MSSLKINPERKAEIKQAVVDCLKLSGIGSLPVPIENIILSVPNLYIKPYSEVAAERNYTEKEVCKALNSNDSCLYQFGKHRGVIFYNDMNRSQIANNRYRWNLAHELGHVCLNHCSDDRTKIWRNSLSNKDYDMYEAEADYFAQLILVPHICLYHMHIYSYKKVVDICKISGGAGSNRKSDYDEWLENRDEQDAYDLAVLKHYKNYVFKNECKSCHSVFIQRGAQYCIFCGKKQLRWSNKEIMKYKRLNTYDNEKLKICPQCNNEETGVNGQFCQICGELLVNACTKDDCHIVLPSNARYCYVCGSMSTFFSNDYLISWEEEQEYTEKEQSSKSWVDEIPDFDEELPFN